MSIAAKDRYGNILTSQNIGITLSSSSYNIVNYEIKDDFLEMVNYIDFAFQILGIDINFNDFKKMSDDERKAFLRDIKINKLL